MIHSVDVSADEVVVGQSITIEVHADSPVQIAVGCFVDKPPPPRFKGCSECNVHFVPIGKPFTITPKSDTWQRDSGGYQFKITDADGYTKIVEVRVLNDSAAAGGAMIAM